MKKNVFLAVISALMLLTSIPSVAQDQAPSSYEYAIVKWDGPDRLYFNYPDKFELKYLSKEGVIIPREAQAEEFCLTWAVNKMAKENWSPTSFDSRRVLFRRIKTK